MQRFGTHRVRNIVDEFYAGGSKGRGSGGGIKNAGVRRIDRRAAVEIGEGTVDVDEDDSC